MAIGQKVAKPTAAEAKRARATVKKRSGGICEGCRQAPATDMHHRLYKSRGGLDTVENLIHLCGGKSGLPGGNHSGCHGIAHTARGERLGWSIQSGDNPKFAADVVPVRHRDRDEWSLFDFDGSTADMHPIDAVEYMRLIGAITDGMVA